MARLTEEAVKRLIEARLGPGERIRYLFQGNQGKSVALNKALSDAKGKLIAFLDSDDQWLPTKIEEQFKALQEYASQSQTCFTDARFINNPCFQRSTFVRASKQFAAQTGVLRNSTEVVGGFRASVASGFRW